MSRAVRHTHRRWPAACPYPELTTDNYTEYHRPQIDEAATTMYVPLPATSPAE